MFPRQQILQLAISEREGRFCPPPWQIGLSHCLVILYTLSYNLGGVSTIISNHHPMSQNQTFQTMEPLIDLLSVCKFEFLSYSPVRKRKQKKNLGLYVSQLIAAAQQSLKTRLITMRSKPNYVEFVLLQLLLVLLLWYLLLQLFIIIG